MSARKLNRTTVGDPVPLADDTALDDFGPAAAHPAPPTIVAIRAVPLPAEPPLGPTPTGGVRLDVTVELDAFADEPGQSLSRGAPAAIPQAEPAWSPAAASDSKPPPAKHDWLNPGRAAVICLVLVATAAWVQHRTLPAEAVTPPPGAPGSAVTAAHSDPTLPSAFPSTVLGSSATTPTALGGAPLDEPARPAAAQGQALPVQVPPIQAPRAQATNVTVPSPSAVTVLPTFGAELEPALIAALPDTRAFDSLAVVLAPGVENPAATAAVAAPGALPVPVPAAVLPAAAASPGRDPEARAIEGVLRQYRNAFNRLDAGAASLVWPTVDEATLARAFERLEGQDVSFDSCQIEVASAQASAACHGSARYVPRVGSRTPKAEPRHWTFSLRKDGGEWLIDRVDTR